MITKTKWKELLWDIDYEKKHTWFCENNPTKLYIRMLLLILLTPVFAVIDILLFPFEIGLYFFNKYMRGDFK